MATATAQLQQRLHSGSRLRIAQHDMDSAYPAAAGPHTCTGRGWHVLGHPLPHRRRRQPCHRRWHGWVHHYGGSCCRWRPGHWGRHHWRRRQRRRLHHRRPVDGGLRGPHRRRRAQHWLGHVDCWCAAPCLRLLLPLLLDSPPLVVQCGALGGGAVPGNGPVIACRVMVTGQLVRGRGARVCGA